MATTASEISPRAPPAVLGVRLSFAIEEGGG